MRAAKLCRSTALLAAMLACAAVLGAHAADQCLVNGCDDMKGCLQCTSKKTKADGSIEVTLATRASFTKPGGTTNTCKNSGSYSWMCCRGNSDAGALGNTACTVDSCSDLDASGGRVLGGKCTGVAAVDDSAITLTLGAGSTGFQIQVHDGQLAGSGFDCSRDAGADLTFEERKEIQDNCCGGGGGSTNCEGDTHTCTLTYALSECDDINEEDNACADVESCLEDADCADETAAELVSNPTSCKKFVCGKDVNECPTCVAEIATERTCRPKNGACDVAETCALNTGTNYACPNDDKEPTTTVCRKADGPCDVDDKCDGKNNACPNDDKEPTTTVCRKADGPCDVDDKCDGKNNACPTDGVAASGTECRKAGNTEHLGATCDPAEVCDGKAKTCPPDSFSNYGYTTKCGGTCFLCGVKQSQLTSALVKNGKTTATQWSFGNVVLGECYAFVQLGDECKTQCVSQDCSYIDPETKKPVGVQNSLSNLLVGQCSGSGWSVVKKYEVDENTQNNLVSSGSSVLSYRFFQSDGFCPARFQYSLRDKITTTTSLSFDTCAEDTCDCVEVGGKYRKVSDNTECTPVVVPPGRRLSAVGGRKQL